MNNYFNDKETIGFTCDVCGRKVNGCHYINGMKFCAKCYQETFGKDNQQNEIQQLKQRLEEKDKEIERLKQELEETNAGYDFTYEQSTETIKELKQNQTQLAIQELEKVKDYICDYSEITGQAWSHTLRFLNKRINELKGEIK